MQSRGAREKGTVILICPRCHSNRERSDTSINSPSSTKFTLLFRTPQYFISSCRISQSYFQSQSCHRGVAVRQLVVIMTIYSSGSEELFFPQFSLPKRIIVASLPHSIIRFFSYCMIEILSIFPPFIHLPVFPLVAGWIDLAICPSFILSLQLVSA